MLRLLDRYYNAEKDCDNSAHRNPEEIADTLLSLCIAVENGTLVQAAPENLVIKEDGTISIFNKTGMNLYYVAPELILSQNAPEKSASWFALGLLAYFVINGRSYYDDFNENIVDLPELMERRDSLISSQGTAPDAEDVPGLFRLAMVKFTSWNPEERKAGVGFLLKAVQQYSSTAEVSYLYEGEIIGTENIKILPPVKVLDTGSLVTGNDGTVYQVKEACKLSFRPGIHRCTVQVTEHKVQKKTYQRYLTIQEASQKQKIRLMELGSEFQSKKISIERTVDKRYLFQAETVDPYQDTVIAEEYKDKIDIRRSDTDTRLQMQISYDPIDSVCEVTIYNAAGIERLSSKAKRFEV